MAIGEIAVFGGTSYDTLVTVRSFPQADEKVWGRVLGQYCGGMGANVAWTIAALGGRARLFSTVGDDEAGDSCLSSLRHPLIDLSGVVVRNGRTFETLAMVDGSGEKAMVMLLREGRTHPGRAVAPRSFPADTMVHVALNAGSPDIGLVEDWVRRGARLAIDVEPVSAKQDSIDIERWLRATTFLFCGDEASRIMAGSGSPEKRARRLLGSGPSVVALTLGKQGCLVTTSTGEVYRRKGEEVRPVDSTGSGDCFAGVSLYGIANGWPPRTWASAANVAAAATTEVLGARNPDLTLDRLLKDPRLDGVHFPHVED